MPFFLLIQSSLLLQKSDASEQSFLFLLQHNNETFLKKNLYDSQLCELSEILIDLLKVKTPANEIRGLNRK
jgi:hypothetical protein